ncbi:MAG: hypothetical protein ACMXYC_00210 [Candidatus Woesearchaeota archaeon]
MKIILYGLLIALCMSMVVADREVALLYEDDRGIYLRYAQLQYAIERQYELAQAIEERLGERVFEAHKNRLLHFSNRIDEVLDAYANQDIERQEVIDTFIELRTQSAYVVSLMREQVQGRVAPQDREELLAQRYAQQRRAFIAEQQDRVRQARQELIAQSQERQQELVAQRRQEAQQRVAQIEEQTRQRLREQPLQREETTPNAREQIRQQDIQSREVTQTNITREQQERQRSEQDVRQTPQDTQEVRR